MQLTFNKVPKIEGLDFKSTIPMIPDRDVIGFLGQAAVAHVLKDADAYPYFNSDYKGDEYDLFTNERVDVKASKIRVDPEDPYRKYLVRDGTKETDRYIFTVVDLDNLKVYIVGTITYNRFNEISRPMIHPRIKYPCRYVFRRELEPFEEYAEKVKETKIDS